MPEAAVSVLARSCTRRFAPGSDRRRGPRCRPDRPRTHAASQRPAPRLRAVMPSATPKSGGATTKASCSGAACARIRKADAGDLHGSNSGRSPSSDDVASVSAVARQPDAVHERAVRRADVLDVGTSRRGSKRMACRGYSSAGSGTSLLLPRRLSTAATRASTRLLVERRAREHDQAAGSPRSAGSGRRTPQPAARGSSIPAAGAGRAPPSGRFAR